MRRLLYILPMLLLMGTQVDEEKIVFNFDKNGITINGVKIENDNAREQFIKLFGNPDKVESDDITVAESYYNKGFFIFYNDYKKYPKASIVLSLRDGDRLYDKFNGSVIVNGVDLPFTISREELVEKLKFKRKKIKALGISEYTIRTKNQGIDIQYHEDIEPHSIIFDFY